MGSSMSRWQQGRTFWPLGFLSNQPREGRAAISRALESCVCNEERRRAGRAVCPTSAAEVLPRVQATLRRFDCGKAAAFLFDQIIFDAAHGFGSFENRLPGRIAFAEQNAVAAIRSTGA